jgi:hypothetical protein
MLPDKFANSVSERSISLRTDTAAAQQTTTKRMWACHRVGIRLQKGKWKSGRVRAMWCKNDEFGGGILTPLSFGGGSFTNIFRDFYHSAHCKTLLCGQQVCQKKPIKSVFDNFAYLSVAVTLRDAVYNFTIKQVYN